MREKQFQFRLSPEDASWLRERIAGTGISENEYLKRVVERAVVKMRQEPERQAVWEGTGSSSLPDGITSRSLPSSGTGSKESSPPRLPPSSTSEPSVPPTTTGTPGQPSPGSEKPSTGGASKHRHTDAVKVGEPFGKGGYMWQARACACGQVMEATRL
jgi:hypothetical protein